MKRIIILLTCFSVLYFKINKAQICGVERWNIKTLSDADTVKVRFDTIITSTIPEQTLIPRPIGNKRRRLDSELNVYSIDCFIVGYKLEEDKDIHVVIEDIKTDSTMVAEIISPLCPEVIQTSRYKTYQEVEDWFIKNIGFPTAKYKGLEKPIRVIITGVGFFDHMHGQIGMAANGREIHPVLSINCN